MRIQGPLIVGGGPAGCAAAIALARGGVRATLLERTVDPHDALCGGFVSWNAARHLVDLGVDPRVLGARPVTQVRLFAGDTDARADLPSLSWSISRRALDDALLKRARACGTAIERGVRAVGLEDGRVLLADAGEVAAERIVLATGKHELRGNRRSGTRRDPAMGLRWRLGGSVRLERLLAQSVDLHLFDRGYAGLALQEDGSANLCMAVKRSLLSECGGDPSQLLARLARANPALGERLDCASTLPAKAQAIANVPYGWIAKSYGVPAYRVGDQSAVIPSLAGEGIAIALAGGHAAGAAILGGASHEAFQRSMSRRALVPVKAAGMVMQLAQRPQLARLTVRAVRLAPGLAEAAARVSRIRWPATARHEA